MRKRLLIAAAAISILLPAALLAGHSHLEGHDKGKGLLNHVAEELDLTAAQKEQVHGLFAAHREELVTQISRFRTAHEALARAVHAPLGEAEVRAAAHAVGEAGEELAVIHSRLVGEFRRVLTPEQLEKAHEMLSRLHAHGEKFLAHLEEHLAGER